MISPENISLFESYLDKTLDDKEMQAFEAKLEQDKLLHSDFTSYVEIRRLLQNSSAINPKTLEFQKNIKDISTAYFADNIQQESSDKQEFQISVKKKQTNYMRIAFGAAACIAIFFGIKFYFFSPSLYQQYQVYANVSLQVRGTSSVNQNLDEAIALYNQKKYKESVETLSKEALLPDANVQIVNASIIANIECEKYDAALGLIERQLAQKDVLPDNILFAQYQKVLLFVKQKNTIQAKSALEKLQTMQGYEIWGLRDKAALLKDKL